MQASRAGYRLGVDVGGTFTDFTLIDETSGVVQVFKCPSTPDQPHRAVLNGIRGMAEEFGISPADITYFVHGTTIAVNTVIQRNGARVGLLVTEGFRDLMTLGRSRLSDTYSFLVEKPEPLVPRRLVREIPERSLANGRPFRDLDEARVSEAALDLQREGAETIAICFLHSFRNSAHELRAKEIVRSACPGLYVCTSSEVWPQMREYERALVTVINAHVGPRMDAYFDRLIDDVGQMGVQSTVFVTKSNGGVMTARSARSVPVQTLISGPAAGVSGASYIGRLAGIDKLIALDMGGTSTEVAVIDRDVLYSTENTVGDFQVVTPAVDVNSIGAGGGSIAWTDPSGVLKVGPRSAGADPGPACYGLGGENPTITDAYVVLGIIDPDRFLGGRMKLERHLAEKSVANIAKVVGLDLVHTAEAIVRVATSNMYSALVPLMAQKGVDISEFSLLVYGGAGPTHGFLLAREVDIRRVVVPPHPGTLCALGCLVSDLKSDFIRTINVEIDPKDPDQASTSLRQALEQLQEQAVEWLVGERVRVTSSRVQFSADMRFAGQAFEIEVAIGDVKLSDLSLGSRTLDAFYDRYHTLYTVGALPGMIEVVNVRATIVGTMPRPETSKSAGPMLSGARAKPEPVGWHPVYLDGQVHQTAVYERDLLQWGHSFEGPAVVQQYDSTVFIPPKSIVTVDAFGILLGDVSP